MERDFSRLGGQHFDLLIIGGGVYGAWTAYDAALRGLKVALVERGDWACGASSASSKLIHGGLRYLETFDLKLVKKALKERRRLLELAPHRVWPLRFGIPLYEGESRIGPLRLKAGLTLYDFLGGEQTHRRHGRDAFAERFPSLDPTRLKEGFSYVDAQTDDARFVLELVDGALSAGAVCLNYCEAGAYLERGGRARGAEIDDLAGGRRVTVYAERIVNAAGQWMRRFDPLLPFRLTKGVHLVLPRSLGDDALLLTAKSDGRVFFMLPWYGRTLLGTTDTDYHGGLDRVTVEPEDAAYLLEEAGRVLKTAWRGKEILGRFAGLRVLRSRIGRAPSELSRDFEMKSAPNGVIYSIGGKLTSAREDAARMVDEICRSLGAPRPCFSGGKPFPWRPEGDFGPWRERTAAAAGRLGIDAESAVWLIRRHGKRVFPLFRLIEATPALAERIFPALPLIRADLVFCAREEMVVHLEDLLRRRLPLLILSAMTPEQLASLGAQTAAVAGWDLQKREREIELCRSRWLEPE